MLYYKKIYYGNNHYNKSDIRCICASKHWTYSKEKEKVN